MEVRGDGSDNIAALMALTAIAHTADPATGVARAIYDDLYAWTELSRVKLLNGPCVLAHIK